MKTNSFLLIKQGFKGVLKYKVQFILIIILGFFASTILGLTYSINQRLENDYKRTVGTTQKFDYISERILNSSSTSNLIYIPLMDFINNQYLTYTDKEGKTISLNYNFNISSFENANDKNNKYNQTFITKAFSDIQFKQAFIKLFTDSDFTKYWFDYQWKEENGENNYSYNVYGPKLKSTDLEKYYWSQFSGWDPKKSHYADSVYERVQLLDNNNEERVVKDFFNISVHLLKKYFIEDLLIKNKWKESKDKGSVQYLNNSMYQKLINQGYIQKVDLEKLIKINDYYNIEDKKIEELNSYMIFSFSLILLQLNKMMHDYINHFMQLAIVGDIENGNSKLKEDVLKRFCKYSGIEEYIINDPKSDEFANYMYAYLFGKTIDIKYKDNRLASKFIVNNKNKPWTNKIQDSFNNIILYSENDLYDKGARGSLNQIVKTNDSYQTIDNLIALQARDQASEINQIIANPVYYYYKDNYSIEHTNYVTSYFVREKLLGLAYDLSVETRYEAYLADNRTELKYRFIIKTEEEMNKLTIYQGKKPRLNNEIILNPQFAKANKIQIGQAITISGQTLVISGYGADPYSYFPAADPNIPFPNNKKGAIVYLTGQQFFNFFFKGSQDLKVMNQSIFSSITKKSKNSDVSNFYNSHFQLKDKININYQNESENLSDNYGLEIISYKDSLFNLNWELTPLVLKIFLIISYTVCAILIIICLITTLIAIKKTIEFNSGEIGILKSLGAKSNEIAIGYISYGLVLTFIVIPFAWILAGVIQNWFSNLFLSYMSGSYDILQYEPISLFISIGLFGFTVIVFSYFIAWKLIKKPVLQIINKKEIIKRIEWLDNLKIKATKNMKFTTRFSVELAISGLKPTILTATTVFITSILISASMVIPSTVKNGVDTYYKNLNYANSVKNIEPIGNSPLSKTSVSPWQGPEYYDKFLSKSNSIFGKELGKISDSVTNISGPVDYSMVPKIIMNPSSDGSKQNDVWSYELLANASNYQKDMFASLTSIFGNTIAQTLGKGINIAEIQRLLEWTIHDSAIKNKQDRINKLNQTSKILTDAIPQVLDLIFPSSGSAEEANTWKDKIINLIMTESPSYVKGFVENNENRYNQFIFGWTVNNYIPGVDDFYTLANTITKNKYDLNITGLQENQNAYNLKNKKSVFLDNNDIESINNLVYQLDDSSKSVKQIKLKNGFKIYDNKTLNIPVIINNQAKLNLKKSNDSLNNIKFKTQRLLLDGKYNIPNQAWMYNDSSWSKYSDRENNKNVPTWIEASKLDASKFSYAKSFDLLKNPNNSEDNPSLKPYSYGFIDLYQTNNGLDWQIRPLYDYDNLFLFVPKEYKSSFDSIAKTGKNSELLIGDVNDSKTIPKETIKAWSHIMGKEEMQPKDFIWIRPYSHLFDVEVDQLPEENLKGDELNNLLNPKKNLFQANFNSDKPLISVGTIEMDWTNISNGLVEKINLTPVDQIDIYGKDLVIADQNLINILNGYGIEKYIPVNYVFEDILSKKTTTINGEQVSLYDKLTPKQMMEKYKDQKVYGIGEQTNIYPSKWYNGVYTASKEPYFLTSQVSFSKSVRVGEDTLNGTSAYSAVIELDKVEFLTEQKAMIHQIAFLVLAIGITFITVIIITSTLATIIITDLYVNQYKKFMVVMKSIGYSNWKIIKYSFGTVTIISIISMLLGFGISGLGTYLILSYINTNIGAIPAGITWWAPFASSALIIGAYIVSILITTRKIRTESPINAFN